MERTRYFQWQNPRPKPKQTQLQEAEPPVARESPGQVAMLAESFRSLCAWLPNSMVPADSSREAW